MVYRYRTNLKKVFLTDLELHQLLRATVKISQSMSEKFCLIPICLLSQLTRIFMTS